jgi:PilZ domain
MLSRRRDNRKAVRLPVRRAAEVFFGRREPPVRCVIWDISDGGARLAVAHPILTLPPIFTLSLRRDGSEQRKCEVVWTDARYVGVRFV